MGKRFEEIKTYYSKQKEKGYRIDSDIEWLIEQIEKQTEIIEGQQIEIDWLRSLPLSNG